jgi:hypothetical protein
MKIKTNEYGAIECFENTFVAGASGWGLNVIDLYFAPQRTLPLTVDRVVYSFKRADGVTIGRLEATLTSENVDTTLGAECYRYEIKDSDGVLGVAGALGISAELLHVVLNDDDEVIDLQKIATIRCAANVYNNVAIEDIEDYNALAVMVDELSNLLAAYNTRLNEMRGELDDIEPGAQVNVIETVKVNGVALTPTDKAVNVTVPTQAELDGKVDKVDGKGLSTNDYTTVEKTKLASIEEGAEVNVIETVKVNGVALTPISKAVDITNVAKTNEFNNFTHKQTFDNGVEITGHTIINGYLMGNAIDAKGHVSIIDANELGAVTLLPQPGIENVNRTVTIPFKNGTLALTSDIPTTASEVGALPDTTLYGATIDLSYTANTGVLGVTLKDQNGNTLNSDTVDLPLELLIQSGSVQTCTTANVPVSGYVVGDKYIDLVLANSEHIYILVSDLIDQVTITETGTGNAVTDITVNGNVITKTKGKTFVENNDARLTDARPASDVSSWAKAASKPTYTASEVGAIPTTQKGANNGVAELDSTGKVPLLQLPSGITDYEYTDGLVFMFTLSGGAHYEVTGYTGIATEVIIPKYYDDGTNGVAKVTEIGGSAFYNNKTIEKVILPDSIEDIGTSAFESCTYLERINIPEGIEYLYDFVFMCCQSLLPPTIPNTVRLIGSSSFYGCERFTEITLPESVEFIADDAFSYCTNLKKITLLSKTPPSLYTYSFYNTGITSTSGAIYVPYESLEAYKTDTNWVTYANVIYPIPDGKWVSDEIDNIKDGTSVVKKAEQDKNGNDITTTYATKSEITAVYKYKGSVASYANLPSSDQTVGDVYNVEDTGDNYAWDGTAWDKLSGTIDLSGYVPISRTVNGHELSANVTISKADVGLGNVEDGAQVNVIETVKVNGVALTPTNKEVNISALSQSTYTATLPSASWTGSSAPYSKAVTVTGILATDQPDIDIDLSSTAIANIATLQTEWSKVYRAVTSANAITFYATEKPNNSIPLKIKVVR